MGKRRGVDPDKPIELVPAPACACGWLLPRSLQIFLELGALKTEEVERIPPFELTAELSCPSCGHVFFQTQKPDLSRVG